MDGPAADETVILTTKDGRRLTISSRILLQRTTNNKTTESYHYDAAGNLTGAEADIKTWEERNTEIYRWLNDAPPPFDSVDRRGPVPSRARTVAPQDPGLVRMATAVHRVPALAWAGKTTTASKSTKEDQGHELESRVAGRQRSQSEHSVSMKTNVGTPKPAALRPGPTPKFPPFKAVPPRAHVWTPPQAKLQPSTAAGHRGVSNGPLKGRAPVIPSLAERHTKRCMENRRRKQTEYQRGVDY